MTIRDVTKQMALLGFNTLSFNFAHELYTRDDDMNVECVIVNANGGPECFRLFCGAPDPPPDDWKPTDAPDNKPMRYYHAIVNSDQDIIDFIAACEKLPNTNDKGD